MTVMMMAMTVTVVSAIMMTVSATSMSAMATMTMTSVIVASMVVTMSSVVVTSMIVAMTMTVIESGRCGRYKCQSCGCDKGCEQKFHWGLGCFPWLHSCDNCSHILRRSPLFLIHAGAIIFLEARIAPHPTRARMERVEQRTQQGSESATKPPFTAHLCSHQASIPRTTLPG